MTFNHYTINPYNLSIDDLLEDPNLSYSLDKFNADLIRDKIQSTDTAITQCG